MHGFEFYMELLCILKQLVFYFANFLEYINVHIYDKVQGESLLDWVMETGDLDGCAVYMAKLHKSIIQNKISNVPDYKEFLKWNVDNAPLDNSKKREEILQILDKLPDGNALWFYYKIEL